MVEPIETRERRLGIVLLQLQQGKSVNGEPLDYTQIAIRAHDSARQFVIVSAQEKARTVEKLRHRKFTG